MTYVMLASAYLGTIFFLQISAELASMKQSKNSLQMPKSTRKPRKISNLLTTIASGEISLQSKQDIICHVTKVKATTSAHSVAELIPFFSVFNIRFESNASIDKTKRKYIIHTIKKNIRNIFRTFMLQCVCATSGELAKKSRESHNQRLRYPRLS